MSIHHHQSSFHHRMFHCLRLDHFRKSQVHCICKCSDCLDKCKRFQPCKKTSNHRHWCYFCHHKTHQRPTIHLRKLVSIVLTSHWNQLESNLYKRWQHCRLNNQLCMGDNHCWRQRKIQFDKWWVKEWPFRTIHNCLSKIHQHRHIPWFQFCTEGSMGRMRIFLGTQINWAWCIWVHRRQLSCSLSNCFCRYIDRLK